MPEQEIVSRTIYSILILTNVLGNSLVILIILRSRPRKTPMNCLLLNLAVADLTAGVFYIPLAILEGTFTYPRGLSGAVFCKLVVSKYFMVTSLCSPAFSLVLIAFDRYYARMKPFSIRHRIPNLYFRTYDNKARVCRLDLGQAILKSTVLYWLFITGILPTSIMSVLYSRVIHRLWFENDANSATLQATRLSRKRITKTMLLISTIYVLCWFPDLVRHVLEAFFPSHFSFSSSSSDIFHSIVLLNSTVNPFIYPFQFENFRRELRKIFCCGWRDSRIHVTQRARGQEVAGNGEVNLEMARTDGT